MMKVFLDTNIMLDVILDRKHKISCQRILQAGIEEDIELCASILSFANMAYILQKEKLPKKKIYAVERDFESIIDTLPMDRVQLRESLANEVKDFEDMLQYQCALNGGSDCIVTINTRHFKPFSKLPIYTPNELLNLLTAQEN